MGFRCGLCSTVDGVKSCTYSTKLWRIIYPRCFRTNVLCSNLRGAFLPVITICNQQL